MVPPTSRLSLARMFQSTRRNGRSLALRPTFQQKSSPPGDASEFGPRENTNGENLAGKNIDPCSRARRTLLLTLEENADALPATGGGGLAPPRRQRAAPRSFWRGILFWPDSTYRPASTESNRNLRNSQISQASRGQVPVVSGHAQKGFALPSGPDGLRAPAPGTQEGSFTPFAAARRVPRPTVSFRGARVHGRRPVYL